MTTTCPACNKTVDPLRSRFVGVQDGRIVAYCSAECAGRMKPAAPARPAPAIVPVATPAAGIDVRSSRRDPDAEPPGVRIPSVGVAARVQSPATGVPLGPVGPLGSPRPVTPAPGVPVAPVGRPQAVTPVPGVPVALVGPPQPVTPASGVPSVLDSGPVIEILHEPASGVVTSARDERTEPRAKHPDEIPIAEFWSADREKSGAVRAAGDPGSGPVAPPGASAPLDERPAAAPRRPARPTPERAVAEPTGSNDALGSDDSGDGLDAIPPRKSRAPLVILLLVLLGAAGYLAYQYYLKGNLAAATRVTPAPAARASPIEGAGNARDPAGPGAASGNPADPQLVGAHPPAPRAIAASVVDITAAVEQARATLHGDLTATSPRVQRIAAEALARTQDPAARDVLAAQLGLPAGDDPLPRGGVTATPAARVRETSDIARLDLAYSLARGGDPRGAQTLAGALGSSRAEVRDEAARLLALLGDARAVPHLTDLLAVSQRRLGAAEHLAHLAEPHAIKVLEQIRGDAKISADDRARATIALGIARHADVAPALRDMLGDPHENAFAAAALAELKDAAARPVLEQQLESPALRVRAARALRRLDPALDPKPVLARLIEILKTGRDIDQVQAAEAILLLAGPASWSAYD